MRNLSHFFTFFILYSVLSFIVLIGASGGWAGIYIGFILLVFYGAIGIILLIILAYAGVKRKFYFDLKPHFLYIVILTQIGLWLSMTGDNGDAGGINPPLGIRILQYNFGLNISESATRTINVLLIPMGILYFILLMIYLVLIIKSLKT